MVKVMICGNFCRVLSRVVLVLCVSVLGVNFEWFMFELVVF